MKFRILSRKRWYDLITHPGWKDDLGKIGVGLIIAGIVTPLLKPAASMFAGLVTVTVGFGILVVIKYIEV